MKQVERSLGESPFNVSSRSVHVLTPRGEPIQFKELVILKAELFHKFGVNILLDRAAIRTTTDRDALDSRRPLEHLTRTVNAVVVRNHRSRNNSLAEPVRSKNRNWRKDRELSLPA